MLLVICWPGGGMSAVGGFDDGVGDRCGCVLRLSSWESEFVWCGLVVNASVDDGFDVVVRYHSCSCSGSLVWWVVLFFDR